jgi:spore maturation protein CgeB
VPLRVFDIMGVGGFMLTNYQPEIEELFTIGKDIEVFHDIDELHDKVSFYLANEKARLQIALNGYKLVSEKYSYDRAIESILAKIG